ncbi:MAG: BLUF domain-containing protein [Nitrospina sp.]|nr:BLUF domain-containing protein [Nitrospina sp.]
MHELFYCSYAAPGINKDDILEILEASRKNNEQLGITGILLYWEKTNEFLQVLEGDREALFELYEKIVQDSRHSLVRLVYHGEIQERGFKNWSMAFQNFDAIDRSKIEGYSNFSTLGFTDERTPIEASAAISLIQTFRDVLP